MSKTYQLVQFNIPGFVAGMPLGTPPPNYGVGIVTSKTQTPALEIPGNNLHRGVNYYADYGGCGWWRMIAPELLMNINNKGVISGLTTMVLDPRFYGEVKAVRLQRQATPQQLEFLKFLKQGSKIHNFKIIYEIDDIIIRDDIPDYNRCKEAFIDDAIINSCVEMMAMSDEISVTCQYMKEYYMSKTGNKNITVIPNYPARMWMDGHYSPQKINNSYHQNKKRPRIAYIGSGTHIDLLNKTNQKDDFSHVVNNIISSRKDFTWVFIGSFPLACKPFIDRGEMEFIEWFPLLELWKAYANTNIQAVYAPLQNNVFNIAKSNIKYLEASTCGIPGVFQNLITYKDAPLKFDNGNEFIDQLKFLLKDENTYMKYSKDARAYADTMWLDDHIDEFKELYFTPFGGERPRLKILNK